VVVSDVSLITVITSLNYFNEIETVFVAIIVRDAKCRGHSMLSCS